MVRAARQKKNAWGCDYRSFTFQHFQWSWKKAWFLFVGIMVLPSRWMATIENDSAVILLWLCVRVPACVCTLYQTMSQQLCKVSLPYLVRKTAIFGIATKTSLLHIVQWMDSQSLATIETYNIFILLWLRKWCCQ